MFIFWPACSRQSTDIEIDRLLWKEKLQIQKQALSPCLCPWACNNLIYRESFWRITELLSVDHWSMQMS